MRWLNVCFLAVLPVFGGNAVQSDWSGGPSSSGCAGSWNSVFAGSENVSFSAVPGQICLSSVPSALPAEEIVDQSLPVSCLSSSDVNGDGRLDLACASLVSGHVWWFENSAAGSWIPHELPGEFSGALGCSFFDVDGDGFQDLLAGTTEPDLVVYWKNIAGSGEFGSPVQVDYLPGVHCVMGCFADDDSLADMIAAGNECDQIAVWFGLGDDLWEKVIIDSLFTGTQSVSPGDLDGDGDTDVVGAALELGQFAWWENPGTRSDPWTKHIVADDMPGAHYTAAVDINQDGFTDVLGASFSNSKITWWENDGSSPPEWTKHTIAPSLTGALTAVAGDFDGDNDIDVAAAGWVIDRVMWYENLDGSGESWQARTVASGFNGAWPLACGDFSGNGRVQLAAGADVLSGSGPSHGISVFDLCTFCEDGSLLSSVLDTQEEPQWAGFEFDSYNPESGSVQLFWRSSDDPENLGDWFGPFSQWAELSGLIERFVQYRVDLGCPEGVLSPVVSEIRLNWDPNGIHEEQAGSILLFAPVSNPSFGESVTVCIEDCSMLPFSTVNLKMFELSGRIAGTVSGCCPEESVEFNDLSPGVYILRADCGPYSRSQRICVLR